MNIQNYVLGQWVNGGASEYEAQARHHGRFLGPRVQRGPELRDILAYGREKGGSRPCAP